MKNDNGKNTVFLSLVFSMIIVSSFLSFTIVLFNGVHPKSDVKTNYQVLGVQTQTSATKSPQSVNSFNGNVLAYFDKVDNNKYSLILDTNGTKVSVVDLRFAVNNGTQGILVDKGNITELNDLLYAEITSNEIRVQAGNLIGFTGKNILATFSLSSEAINNLPIKLNVLPNSMVNSGYDLSKNELSSEDKNYQFTLD